MTTKNPWLGLASYEEPKNDGNDYLFCGRDEETLDVVRLIDNNLFITLYGSSGIGKTSLLRAGVIPILRRKDYFPLYVRLSQEPKEISYAEAIVRKLQSSGLMEEKGAAMKHPDGNDRLYLWNYFAITRFLKDGREVYPVIILDQFEEVFREGDKAKAELLLKQIYLLLNDELEMPNETGYSADTNYRFVASIREDFLFVLEDSIDENSLDLYKNNRYRLRPMKPEQARQVVLVPGKDCIEENEKDAIAERIISLAKRPQSEDIDTLLLSIVCSGTYDKKAGEKITSFDLAAWKNNPMEVYYQDAMKGLTAAQIRYIQQHLIRDDGSRRRVDAEEVRTALGETIYRQLAQGANRLFAVGDKGQVELLHDQLGMAVYEERKAFEERERKKKQRRKMVAIGIIVIGFIFLSTTLLYLANTNLITQNSLEKSLLQRDSLQVLNESLAHQICLNDMQNDSILKLNEYLSDQMKIISIKSDSLSKSLSALQLQIRKNKEQEEIIIQQENVINGKSQSGRVKTKGRPDAPGTPLSGVTIKVKGYSAVISNSEGDFWLPIPHGEKFKFDTIIKEGYELVNSEILHRELVASQLPIQIVLVAQKDLYEDYRRLSGNVFKVQEERMQEIINKLKKENDSLKLQIQFLKVQMGTTNPEAQHDSNAISTENYLDLLKMEYDRKLSLIGDMADRYARTDYDNLDSIDYQINLCIENGELDKADSLIHTAFDPETVLECNRAAKQEIAERIALAQSIIDKANTDREAIMRDIEYAERVVTLGHNLARLYLIREEKDKAKECLQQVIEIECLLYGEDSQIVKETQSQIEAIDKKMGVSRSKREVVQRRF